MFGNPQAMQWLDHRVLFCNVPAALYCTFALCLCTALLQLYSGCRTSQNHHTSCTILLHCTVVLQVYSHCTTSQILIPLCVGRKVWSTPIAFLTAGFLKDNVFCCHFVLIIVMHHRRGVQNSVSLAIRS